MLRRAFLISSIMGAVSAAAALALAPDLSRVGRVVSSLAPWKAGGFTHAPLRDTIHGLASGLIGQPPDTLEGKFCRFPPDVAGTAGHGTDSTVGRESDSSILTLEGQSQFVSPDSAAI